MIVLSFCISVLFTIISKLSPLLTLNGIVDSTPFTLYVTPLAFNSVLDIYLAFKSIGIVALVTPLFNVTEIHIVF